MGQILIESKQITKSLYSAPLWFYAFTSFCVACVWVPTQLFPTFMGGINKVRKVKENLKLVDNIVTTWDVLKEQQDVKTKITGR